MNNNMSFSHGSWVVGQNPRTITGQWHLSASMPQSDNEHSVDNATSTSDSRPTTHDSRLILLLCYIELRNPGPLQAAAQALRAQFPDCEIACVDTPATRAVESEIAGIDRWITYEGGLEQIRNLRRLHPAALCVLYQTPQAHAHLKLEMLAVMIGAGKLICAFDPAPDQLVADSFSSLWLRIVGKSLLMLLHGGFAAILSLGVGIFLGISDLLVRPGERLGALQAGEKK
jgi:hypothetical protein